MDQTTLEQLLARGDDYFRAKQYDEASHCYHEYLRFRPTHARVRASLGEIAYLQGLLPLAEQHLMQALADDSNLHTAANSLAILYRNTNRPDKARDLLLETLRRFPQFPEAQYNLGNAYYQMHDYEAAVQAFEAALRLKPNYPKALVNLTRTYHRTIQLDRCLASIRRAFEIDPRPRYLSVLLFYSMFSPDVSPEQLAAQAEEWERRFAAPLRDSSMLPGDERQGDRETRRQGEGKTVDTTLPVSLSPCLPVSLSKDLDRPLRVGYVAPTFRDHVIGHLIEPVFANHDRSRFMPYCYSGSPEKDDVTDRFRSLAHVFRDTKGISDEDLTKTIREDQIDILIDLNLHMERSRLGVFARRAAPVQINYLAYPFTSGLRAFDYRVTDAILDPPGQPVHGPETPIRLRTSFWLHRPDPAFPEPAATLPVRSSGRFTFASLTFTQKLNPLVIEVWTCILKQVRNARLLLLAENPEAQTRFISERFANAGLDPARLEILGPVDRVAYYGRYQEIDLCLDPIPYGGHTTTLDALWMGTPVVTLAGRAPYQRAAASLLSRVGLEELITHHPRQYEDLAVTLAGDLDRLEALRHDLRGRMRASVLCDEVGFTIDFERALRMAWQRHCQGLPPEEINLTESAESLAVSRNGMGG